MISRIFTLAFISISSYCYGQTPQEGLILTDIQNKRWLDTLKNQPLEKQINSITERIISDTNVYIRHDYADGINKDYSIQEKTKVEGCCKPIFIIEPTNTVFYFDDKFEQINLHKEVSEFKHTLNEIKINNIRILPQNEAIAIWGSRAANGAIVLSVTNKQSIKLLKKTYKHHK